MSGPLWAASLPVTPPPVLREFRAAWMTCVATNPDWPSRPGLTVARQQAELIALLDRAKQLHLNAVIFQVRPACNAMYASRIEPWCESLSGVQGQPPIPFYDPLAFAIQQAHRRGLELHAWFNPFRAWQPLSKSPPAFNHVSRAHPGFLRKYGGQLWLDPGEPAVRQYVLNVVMDVVRRYDVDGVTFDDYFYPYPETGADGILQFPDYATWKKYGGGLSRADWRRDNINQFVHGVYQSIKAAKPWVKFGISPFGIWRPGYPKGVEGLDAYNTLFADSRLWLANGWVDYLAPQLYWPIDSPHQSFPALLDWWHAQNVKHRRLWPGLNAAAVGDRFSAGEFARQIQLIRSRSRAPGEIFFHLNSLSREPGLFSIIEAQNQEPALVPASPWLENAAPAPPKLVITSDSRSRVTVRWESAGGPAWLWVLQVLRRDGEWTTEILPGNLSGGVFERKGTDVICVRAVDRAESSSPVAAIRLDPR
ncbi:MAG: family 10 glycosylhydrolase [Verrucomicrobia bacterium]|nr:family 10 glycosylhydrolase [Verrucomicrobiota bacterium]